MTGKKNTLSSVTICGFMIAVGLYLGALSYVADILARHFNMAGTSAGIFLTAAAAGNLLCHILFGGLSDRIGKNRASCLYIGAIVIGSVTVAFSQWLPLTLAGLFIAGMGTAPAEVASSALLTDMNPGRSTTWLNISQVAFCIGSLSAPVAAAAYLATGGATYTFVFLALAVCTGVFGAYFGMRARSDVIHERRTKTDIPFDVLKNRDFTFLVVLAFLYLCYESVVPAYSKQLFLQNGATEGEAALAISVFWFAMISARLIGAFLSGKERVCIRLFTPVFIAGIALLLTAQSLTLRLVAVALCGFGCGPVWSFLYSLAGAIYPGRTGAAFAVMSVGTATANVLAPILLGTLVGNAAITLVCTGAIGALLLVCSFFISKTPRIEEAQYEGR